MEKSAGDEPGALDEETTVTDVGAGVGVNPIVLQRADPCVLRHGGQYYFTGSHPLYDRIVLRRAERLEDLQAAQEVTIWTRHASGPQSHLIWAPEIHRIAG
ncbi:hypothetical protein FA014_18065, partial [Cellulomonas hominis]